MRERANFAAAICAKNYEDSTIQEIEEARTTDSMLLDREREREREKERERERGGGG